MDKPDHALITIYGDTEQQDMAKAVWSCIPDRDIKLLTPGDAETLEQAAQNSAVIFISLQAQDDPNLKIARILQDNRLVVADIIAFCLEDTGLSPMEIMARGFSGVLMPEDTKDKAFKKYMADRISNGRGRLSRLIKEEEYQRLVDALSSSPTSVIVFDSEKRAVFVSEHYFRAYPKSAPRLRRGLSVFDAFAMMSEEEGVLPDDPRYDDLRRFWHNLDGSVEFTLDSGLSYRVKAVQLQDGRGTIVTATNTTDYVEQQKELEDRTVQLKQALERERDANAVQKQFIDMVSHEFRTPLTIIDGNVQVIQKRFAEMAPEEIERRTQIVRSAVSRFVHMMDGLMSSNMLKSGKFEVYREEVNLARLINDLAEDYASYRDDIHIECDAGNLPETVLLDQKLTTLVLSNLLSNAVKYTDDDARIKIKASHDNGHIEVSVTDNGIGIAAEDLDKIFDRFYRSSNTTGRTGAGIGLNLARDLVQKQGGAIRAKSSGAKGATFIVTLPDYSEDSAAD